MTIKKFKQKGGMYTVEWETSTETFRVTTPDVPEKTLIQARHEFLSTALGYFGSITNAAFYSLTISAGDVPTATLEVDIPTKYLGECARVKFPAVDRTPAYDKSGEYDTANPRNRFNAELAVFVEEIERYASGKRSQRELPFEADLPFDDEEHAVADRVTQFPRVAQ